jgi:hypothetical protein
VDGLLHGTTPLAHGVPLDPGEYELSVEHEGRRLAQRLRVAAGERRTLLFGPVLTPTPPRTPGPEVFLGAQPQAPGATHPFYKTVWFWALAAAVGGAVVVAVTASRRTEYPHADTIFPGS